jgi:hypothetical protein
MPVLALIGWDGKRDIAVCSTTGAGNERLVVSSVVQFSQEKIQFGTLTLFPVENE